LDHMNNLFFIRPDHSYLNKRKRIIYTSYHQQSPTPSGGLWAIEERTCSASGSESVRTWVQRASASSSVKSALHPDPSTCSLVYSSGKCDMVATNAEWNTQRTPSAGAVSIRPSRSSAATDIETAREDGPLVLPSSKS
jgi:hypothetical protein